jgi:hypothetical protein
MEWALQQLEILLKVDLPDFEPQARARLQARLSL